MKVLNDVEGRAVVRHCGCDHEGEVHVVDPIARYGRRAEIDDVLARLRRTPCGRRGRPEIRFVFVSPRFAPGDRRHGA